MWTRLTKGSVVNLENGNGFRVQPMDDERSVRTYSVIATRPNAPHAVLAEGYQSEEEALGALDDFLSAHKIKPVQLQPPITEQEQTDQEAEVSEEDTDDNLSNIDVETDSDKDSDKDAERKTKAPTRKSAK